MKKKGIGAKIMPNTNKQLRDAAYLLGAVAALGYDSEQIREARLCLWMAVEGLTLRKIASVLTDNLGEKYNRQTVKNRLDWAVERASQ